MEHGILNDMAICIVVAWMMAIVAQLLKQPLILAYLAAGFFVGPVGLGLVEHKESIETISELGLILLLFMIGLEIDLKKVLSSGKAILLTGVSQVIGGSLAGLFLFKLVGVALSAGNLDALYLAVAAALSSTVITVKILYDKRELDTLPGRLTLGILVLQDLFAILFLALQPDLNNPRAALLLSSLGKVFLLVVVAFAASRYALPKLFRAVARLPELVLVGALAWCFLIAGFASQLGLSREMGALIAGVAISTYPYTLDVTAKVTSLRDFFVTLFFVTLGMSIQAPTLPLLKTACMIAAFVVGSRLLTVVPVLAGLQSGHRTSLVTAINLCQLSEFSLVIVALGEKSMHISSDTVGATAYAFVILAVLSSYAMLRSEKLWPVLSRGLRRLGSKDLSELHPQPAAHDPKRNIYLLGFSWTASSLLEEIQRKYPDWLEKILVIDFNPHVNEELRNRSVPVIYGDISQRDTLHHAGIEHASLVLCTLPNSVLKGSSNLRLVQQVRELNPQARIIAHAELFSDIPKLYEAGAHFVSVPRLIEANELCSVIDAAQQGLLDQKRAQLDEELKNRQEVIP